MKEIWDFHRSKNYPSKQYKYLSFKMNFSS